MACSLLLLALCLAPPAHGSRVQPTATTSKAPPAPVPAPPPPASKATTTAPPESDEFLAPHNKARAEVGVAALRWSAGLASAAAKTTSQQQRQSGCAFADMGASAYGANQGWASYRARPGEVVGSWVAQARYYTHANNSCAAGQQCGTYTQVVWRRTTDVGCAQATCGTGATLTLCLYDPHGNVKGESPY